MATVEIHSDPVLASSGESFPVGWPGNLDPYLPHAIKVLVEVMREGGLTVLTAFGLHLERDPAQDPEPLPELTPEGLAVAERIAKANATVTDEQILLDPMAGLRGGELAFPGEGFHG